MAKQPSTQECCWSLREGQHHISCQNVCGAPHPAYGRSDPCRKPTGHDGTHQGSSYTDPWTGFKVTATMLTITLTNEDSEVLDTVRLSREELREAQHNGLYARVILAELAAGVS